MIMWVTNMKTVAGKRTHKCPYCDVQFLDHVNTQTGEMSFKCMFVAPHLAILAMWCSISGLLLERDIWNIQSVMLLGKSDSLKSHYFMFYFIMDLISDNFKCFICMSKIMDKSGSMWFLIVSIWIENTLTWIEAERCQFNMSSEEFYTNYC